MLQTLFPMATGTHGLNNGLLVEEQEERSWTAGLGDFQQDRTRLKTCASVFLCVSNGDGKDRQHTRSHTHTQMYSDINRCKSAATPRLLIRHNSYCLFMFTHQYHLFPNEAGRKTRQEMLYRDMHLYTHKHLAHNNILCILRTSSQLS